MWHVSDRFLAAVTTSHHAVVRVEVWDRDGQIPLAVLPGPIDGEVQIGQRHPVRRTCTATFVDPSGDLTPADAHDLLAPYGRELRLWRGIDYGDGDDPELVPLGVFRLKKPLISEVGGGVTITVEGDDRAKAIADNRWSKPRAVKKGTTVGVAIAGILTNRFPGVPLGFDPDDSSLSDTLPTVVFEHGASADPWRDARAIATGAGLDLYFDPQGVAQLAAYPDPDVDHPAATYTEGDTPGNVIVSPARELDTENTYSGVVAAGETMGNEPPVRAEAWDMNPASPTYVGNFGYKPAFLTSPLIVTQAQAAWAAKRNLSRFTGGAEVVTWSQIVNPALDVFDVIAITRTTLKLDSRRLVLDELTVPLHPSGLMTGLARTAIPLITEEGS